MKSLWIAIGLVLGLFGIFLITIYASGWAAMGAVLLIWGDRILNEVLS